MIGDHPEVQILDSHENDTYPDGQAAAIYGNWPPLVNACRKPGEWQTYRHVLRAAPRFEGPKKVRPATYTVMFNGLPVHLSTPVIGRRGPGPAPDQAARRAAPLPQHLGPASAPLRRERRQAPAARLPGCGPAPAEEVNPGRSRPLARVPKGTPHGGNRLVASPASGSSSPGDFGRPARPGPAPGHLHDPRAGGPPRPQAGRPESTSSTRRPGRDHHDRRGEGKGGVNPLQFGACFEDLNHEIYGGLYAQMIFGESFEEGPETALPPGWRY